MSLPGDVGIIARMTRDTIRRALNVVSVKADQTQFGVNVREPGTLVHVRTVYRPKELIIRMAQPPMEPHHQLVFLVDPEGQERARKFVILPERTVIQGQGILQFCGVVSSAAGDEVMAVLEIIELAAEPELPDECGEGRHRFRRGSYFCQCGAETRLSSDGDEVRSDQ